MKKNYLEEFLINKTEEIKKWPYEKFLLADKLKNPFEYYQNHKINIEIECVKVNDGVKVMVECSTLRLFLIYVGKQKFFYKDKYGNLKDIDGDEFYDRKAA